ncbi:unnamed protein product [Chondrus crispus]|uniref:Uncharacterized protein n=1 Tax=Chondrus crispus TaxID=2769 RepID=R7QFV7_CHOCR|nr:unnamed protein product [Chondrus crispus]CDF36643.1 unnamed protein product [Chondrus crispus]|eukprot:XP_005716462.1 unnamed protein product [Chondrus crispus]
MPTRSLRAAEPSISTALSTAWEYPPKNRPNSNPMTPPAVPDKAALNMHDSVPLLIMTSHGGGFWKSAGGGGGHMNCGVLSFGLLLSKMSLVDRWRGDSPDVVKVLEATCSGVSSSGIAARVPASCFDKDDSVPRTKPELEPQAESTVMFQVLLPEYEDHHENKQGRLASSLHQLKLTVQFCVLQYLIGQCGSNLRLKPFTRKLLLVHLTTWHVLHE